MEFLNEEKMNQLYLKLEDWWDNFTKIKLKHWKVCWIEFKKEMELYENLKN